MKLADAYPVRLLCRLLGVPRSSVYYAPQPPPDDPGRRRGALSRFLPGVSSRSAAKVGTSRPHHRLRDLPRASRNTADRSFLAIIAAQPSCFACVGP